MKKKIWLSIAAAAVLLAVLFVPIPQGRYRDGGTEVYRALTYKLVKWRSASEDGIHEAARIYWGAQGRKTLDELWETERERVERSINAEILEITGDSVLASPIEGEPERVSYSKIRFSIKDLSNIGAQVGSIVKVTYRGDIMETHPAQVKAVKWEMAKDLRNIPYPGQWLDKETAQSYGGDKQTPDSIDAVITEIYSDCFFCRYVIPMPETIKVNGALPDEWCVGDQVLVTYKNRYWNDERSRAECDLVSVAESTFRMQPGVAYKPVIYLYPTQETAVSVKLSLDGELTCTYPAYKSGWLVTASPDGTLTDGKGQTYSYLYWEGETRANWDLSKGFCVKGEDTAAFLEEALAKLGLTRREANEFIVYWLPLMQENPYNIICFQTDAYTEAARLEIAPKPDTLIRVFMTYQPSDTYVAMEAQELTAPRRTGFTAVEWGGTAVRGMLR